jgi:outer membrane murein-binding lipoprotein Lpp
MKRSVFAALVAVLALTLAGIAQEAKPDRISGSVRSVDAKAMSIEVNMSQSPSTVRTVFWDANTKVTLVDKPGTAADIKEGMRIVAIGKFEGVKLRATDIRVRPR